MPKGKAIPYSAEEMAWLEANRLLPVADYARGFNAAFGREVDPKNLHALRKRKGWKTGRTGQFETGREPRNKGTKCEPGKGGLHPNARRTQFKPGGRTGKAALNYQPIGAERIVEGYRERKVHDGLPRQSRWQLVHRIEWEAINGLVPEGMCLKCLDGDRLNADPSNWALVPRSILPRLAGGRRKQYLAYDDASPEVRPALLAVAKLDDKARKARRGRGGCEAFTPA